MKQSKPCLRTLARWTSLLALGLATISRGEIPPKAMDSMFDDVSPKGLEIHCHPMKTNCVVGEGVSLWCTLTNTTDSTKPIAWDPQFMTKEFFRCVRSESTWLEGLGVSVLPKIQEPLMIKSAHPHQGGYILFLPPHKSLSFVAGHQAEGFGKFKRMIVYDPVRHATAPLRQQGSMYLRWAGGEKSKDACIFSNVYEYEVVAAEGQPPPK